MKVKKKYLKDHHIKIPIVQIHFIIKNRILLERWIEYIQRDKIKFENLAKNKINHSYLTKIKLKLILLIP